MECGFDCYWADEPGGPEQAIYYTGAEDDEAEPEPEEPEHDGEEETCVTGPTHTFSGPEGSADQPRRLGSADDDRHYGETASEMEGADLVGTAVQYDQRTGLPIDRSLPQEGRRDELETMRMHGVLEAVPLEKLRGKKIGTR